MLVLGIFVGIFDGFGLAMFIPILEMVGSADSPLNSEAMGHFGFLLTFFQNFGLTFSLNSLLFILLGFFTLKGLAKSLEEFVSMRNRQRLATSVRVDAIQSLSGLHFKVFSKADSGEIQNLMSGEVERLSYAFFYYSGFIHQGVLTISYIVLALIANPSFGLLILLGGLLSSLLFRALFQKSKMLSDRLVTHNNIFQGLIIQLVALFKYLKATGLIRDYSSYLIKRVWSIERNLRSISFLQAFLTGIREPLLIGMVIVAIFIQVNWLGEPFSSTLMSLLFFYRGMGAMLNMQTHYNRFLGHSASLNRIAEFITFLKSNQKQTGGQSAYHFDHEIRMNQVCFEYDEKVPVVSDLSMTIKKNETIALIGESGSGKTTIANLIAGLFEPSSGMIYIDGQPLSDLNKEVYQRHIGYISQEPVIFDDTLFNNVTFWQPKNEETMKKFLQVVEQAKISTFFDSLPDKEDSRLGNNGITLSGGQKQRISIARELYKDIDLLIMDEATSALDAETESSIKENIDALKGKLTILIIAHRLSTIKNADRILMLKNGRVDAEGNYKKLESDSPSFKRMLQLQL